MEFLLEDQVSYTSGVSLCSLGALPPQNGLLGRNLTNLSKRPYLTSDNAQGMPGRNEGAASTMRGQFVPRQLFLGQLQLQKDAIPGAQKQGMASRVTAWFLRSKDLPNGSPGTKKKIGSPKKVRPSVWLSPRLHMVPLRRFLDSVTNSALQSSESLSLEQLVLSPHDSRSGKPLPSIQDLRAELILPRTQPMQRKLIPRHRREEDDSEESPIEAPKTIGTLPAPSATHALRSSLSSGVKKMVSVRFRSPVRSPDLDPSSGEKIFLAEKSPQ